MAGKKAETNPNGGLLGRKQAHTLVGADTDRRQLKRMLHENRATSSRAARDLRLQAAVQNNIFNLVDSITFLMQQPSNSSVSLANQLGGIAALHSLSFDLTTLDSLKWLASHVKTANRTSVYGQEGLAGGLLAQELASAQMNLIKRGFSDDTVIVGTDRGLNSIRGAIVTGDTTTRSLLYELVTGSALPDLTELGSVCGYAAVCIHPETGGLGNYGNLRTDVAEKLAKRLAIRLLDLERFIKVANNTRVENVRSPFTPDAAKILASNAETNRRALVNMLGIMGAEFLDQNLTSFLTRPNSQNVITNNATIIIETLISRGVHWVKPLETIRDLCQYFLAAGREEQAREIILQAAKSGLIKLSKFSLKDYQDIGFPSRNAKEHFDFNRVWYKHFTKHWDFSEDPFRHGFENLSHVRVFQGTLFPTHDGHRAIVAGDMFQGVRRRGVRTELVPPGTTYLVSVNTTRPEGDFGHTNEIAHVNHRRRIALRGFSGLPVRITSLPGRGPLANQELVLQMAGGAQESRACGLDRIESTSSLVADLVVAMRDTDLRRFLDDPDRVLNLRQAFSNAKQLTGLVLNGVERARGQNTWFLFAQSQRSDLPGDVRAAYRIMLQHVIHPNSLAYLEEHAEELLA